MDKEAIKHKAYELWEDEGRPHGRDAEHWKKAETLVGGKGKMKEPKRAKTETVSKSKKTQVAGDAKPVKQKASKVVNGQSMKPAIAEKSRTTKTSTVSMKAK